MRTLEQIRSDLQTLRPGQKRSYGSISWLWPLVKEFERQGIRRRQIYNLLLEKGDLPRGTTFENFTGSMTQQKRKSPTTPQ